MKLFFWHVCYSIIMLLVLSCVKNNDANSILESALAVAESIEDDHDKYSALNSVAMGYATIGSYDKAIKVAQKTTDASSEKARAMSTIVSVCCENKKYDKAMQIADMIEDQKEKASAFYLITLNYARNKQMDKAAASLAKSFQIVEKIEDNIDRDKALVNVANGYALIRENDKAAQLLREVRSSLSATNDTSYDFVPSKIIIITECSRGIC